MARFTDFPNWKLLSKEEKDRLKKIAAPLVSANYNLKGELSTSKKELKKGVNNG